MFNSGYSYKLVDRQEKPEQHIICRWKYTFRSKRRRYIINVEQYSNNIYCIKYHAVCHSKSPHKYSMVFDDEYPPKIIRTCIDVMLEFYQMNSLASFGFIGSHSVKRTWKKRTMVNDAKLRIKKEPKDDSKTNTQRYRIYRRTMLNYFGKDTFAHSTNMKCSAYLMINRNCGAIRPFKKSAEKMFMNIYNGLRP